MAVAESALALKVPCAGCVFERACELRREWHNSRTLRVSVG